MATVLTPEMIEALGALAADAADREHCPSVVWGVVADGALAAHGRSGDMSDGHTSRTVFRIASMTKSFTAAAVLALRDEGRLRLDDPIAAFDPVLASVRGTTADAPAIRVRDIMAMASGIATDDAWGDRHLDMTDAEFDDLVAQGFTFASATGTAFEYCNTGYAMLGRIIHRVAGVRPQQFIAERFLEPLGMTRTSWAAPDDGDWAGPYRWEDDALRPDAPPLGDGLFATMGGLWSCVDDLARWVSWFDEAFPARDDVDSGPLCRASRREQQRVQQHDRLVQSAATEHRPARVAAGGYGFGLNSHDYAGLGHVVTHSGGLPGYGSNMRWLPGRRLGAIALANRFYAPMGALTMRLLETLHEHGLVVSGRPPVSPALQVAAERLLVLLSSWDDTAAGALFADNVALDESWDRRRAQAERLGPFELVQIKAWAATSGMIHARRGDGAEQRIELELSPHAVPLVQRYELVG